MSHVGLQEPALQLINLSNLHTLQWALQSSAPLDVPPISTEWLISIFCFSVDATAPILAQRMTAWWKFLGGIQYLAETLKKVANPKGRSHNSSLARLTSKLPHLDDGHVNFLIRALAPHS